MWLKSCVDRMKIVEIIKVLVMPVFFVSPCITTRPDNLAVHRPAFNLPAHANASPINDFLYHIILVQDSHFYSYGFVNSINKNNNKNRESSYFTIPNKVSAARLKCDAILHEKLLCFLWFYFF